MKCVVCQKRSTADAVVAVEFHSEGKSDNGSSHGGGEVSCTAIELLASAICSALLAAPGGEFNTIGVLDDGLVLAISSMMFLLMAIPTFQNKQEIYHLALSKFSARPAKAAAAKVAAIAEIADLIWL